MSLVETPGNGSTSMWRGQCHSHTNRGFPHYIAYLLSLVFGYFNSIVKQLLVLSVVKELPWSSWINLTPGMALSCLYRRVSAAGCVTVALQANMHWASQTTPLICEAKVCVIIRVKADLQAGGWALVLSWPTFWWRDVCTQTIWLVWHTASSHGPGA